MLSRVLNTLRTSSNGVAPLTARNFATSTKPPVRVAVTGASGQIGYAMLFRIASGAMLGPDQPVILQLLELPQAMNSLRGVVMELQDCAFPLLKGIVETFDANKAFEGADYALLVGAKPRGKGMERGDLLRDNAAIFSAQGKALNNHSNTNNVKILVVGNPANTNALITSLNAPKIDPKRIAAMTKLDHNRGLAQIALKANVDVTDISKFAIWGNHSATQFPDLNHATIKGQAATSVIKDQKWVEDVFIPTVQKRGAAIIDARGASSAASAAHSAVSHMREWALGTNGEWTSFAVYSEGEYGVEKGLYFSYPVVVSGGKYSIVQGLTHDAKAQERLKKTQQELVEERNAVQAFLK